MGCSPSKSATSAVLCTQNPPPGTMGGPRRGGGNDGESSSSVCTASDLPNDLDESATTPSTTPLTKKKSARFSESVEAEDMADSSRNNREMMVSGVPNGGSSSNHRSPSSASSTDGDDDGSESSGMMDLSMHSASAIEGGKGLKHSRSVLDEMCNLRKDADLQTNIVHFEVPFGKPIEEVYDGVHDGKILGSGISGVVRLVKHKATGVEYAVKCLDLGLVETEEGLKQLREEIFIMCQLDHPNIVRLEEVYESPSEIYLVQELCLGGELFDRLDEQPEYHYTEAQCARLVKQMLCAVRYIHSKGIIHRDLKLENFLFSSTSTDSELKMIDFGLSKHFKYGEVHHEAVGTPYTVAPEVIRGCYDERCDVWAMGVITFLLLSGDPPFGGCGGPEPLLQVRANILSGKFEFEPEDVWENVSQQARDFIERLLVTDPNERPTAKEAQKIPWLKEWSKKGRGRGSDHKLNPNVVKALVNFKEYSDMRKLLCEVLSFTLLPDQIQDLRREFEIMDTDGSGEISLGALKQVLLHNANVGSLGGLTEEEVEDIFNAMRVRKTETRIHWHEFIAAGLSQCQVDDRNLRLAFDRLDADHKGYITLNNVLDLLGGVDSEDALRRMWGDSMKACNNSHAQISYEDFLLLMKGQTREEHTAAVAAATAPNPSVPGTAPTRQRSSVRQSATFESVRSLGVVLECSDEMIRANGDEDDEKERVDRLGRSTGILLERGALLESPKLSPNFIGSSSKLTPPPLPIIEANEGVATTDAAGRGSVPSLLDGGEETKVKRGSDAPPSKQSEMVPEGLGVSTGSSSVDLPPSVSVERRKSADGTMLNESFSLVLTPPQSPTRGAVDYATPLENRASFANLDSLHLSGATRPPISLPRPEQDLGGRRRSRSVDDMDATTSVVSNSSTASVGTSAAIAASSSGGPEEWHLSADVRRATYLPEHEKSTAGAFLHDTHTPLAVNRKLYRAHRQMRIAVLEASKRFEEQKFLILQQNLEKQEAKKSRGGAGLTMRRGQKKQVSSEAIRNMIRQKEEENQGLVEKANKRGGRGRRTRKKTISDMSGMLSSPPRANFLSNADRSTSADNGDNKLLPEEEEVAVGLEMPVPQEAEEEGVDAATAGGGASMAAPKESVTASPSHGKKEVVGTDANNSPLIIEKPDFRPRPTQLGNFRKTVDPFAAYGEKAGVGVSDALLKRRSDGKLTVSASSTAWLQSVAGGSGVGESAMSRRSSVPDPQKQSSRGVTTSSAHDRFHSSLEGGFVVSPTPIAPKKKNTGGELPPLLPL